MNDNDSRRRDYINDMSIERDKTRTEAIRAAERRHVDEVARLIELLATALDHLALATPDRVTRSVAQQAAKKARAVIRGDK